MLEATYELVKADPDVYGQEALGVLADIAETEPKFLKKSFDKVLIMVKEVKPIIFF